MAQRVLRNSTATLVTYPPVHAQASAATARIRTPTFDLPDDGAAATVDSLSTTTSAAADEGETSISVASATWARGRRYALTTGDQRFPILSASDGAETTLVLREPLPMPVASGAAIKGMQVSIALTEAQTAELSDHCLVEWTATIDGEEHVWVDDFAIVERSQSYTLDSIRLSQDSPFCQRMRGDSDADFSEMIDAAWRRYVELPLLAKGIKPHLILSRRELEPVHVAACEHFAAQASLDIDQATRDEKKEELNAALAMVLSSETLWIDTNAQVLTPPPSPSAPRPWNTTVVTR